MAEILSTTEAKHLLQLCKTGRLFDVQDWIASGKSLRVPTELKTTPLELALDTGFHSLVELLLRNEASQDLKNRALYRAVSYKSLDFIELLVSHGAEIKSVPFIEVLRVWEPTTFVTSSITAPTSPLNLPSQLHSARRSEQHFVPGESVEKTSPLSLRCFRNTVIELFATSVSMATSSG